MKYIITHFEQTSDTGAPSRWEGVTSRNKAVYARWRHDYLRVVVGRYDWDWYITNKKNILNHCKVVYFEYHPSSKEWLTTERLMKILEKKFVFVCVPIVMWTEVKDEDKFDSY